MEAELSVGGPDLAVPEFRFLQSFIHKNFGISLADHKRGMLASRLRKVLDKHRLVSFKDYIDTCLQRPSPDVLEELMNVVSTNHTYFNREPAHYDFFTRVLPELSQRAERRAKRKELRGWCAAASYGHEPYTLAMLLREHFGAGYREWDAGLLATDISAQALAVADKGEYPDEQVDAMPAHLRERYLQRTGPDLWKVKPELKKDVLFRRFNLMNPIPFKRPFDYVFIRNVMIYFDTETRVELVKRIAQYIHPGGYLVVGLSESLPRGIPGIQSVSSGVYQRR
ncbi:MAG: protein-glutamate O-methyltransferase CheR [Polyangiaceae bacterium]|nr:protein-glutamate O-methyltransferase CheR [Polyangiaceae bacterium]